MEPDRRHAVHSVAPEQLPRAARWDRRGFVKGLTALAGSAGLLGYDLVSAAAEPPPEIKKIRLVRTIAVCLAPQYLAEELLRLEGFTDVQYVEQVPGGTLVDVLEKGQADLTLEAAPALVYAMDGYPSLVALAGIHSGCYELIGNDSVRTVRDLRGKRVGVYALGGADHVFLSSMLAYIGLDPRKDVQWVTDDKIGDAMLRFMDGKVDVLMGFAPQPQELRAKKIGHVIVDTAQDPPWSDYFCCMLVANREFVAKYPIATKRAVRAILRAADICSQDPERAARYMAEKGYEPRYQLGLEVLKGLPYNRWRTASPEDTLRFHALRLHEVGMIKTNPAKLISQRTDWRFLNELKRELKA